MTQENGAETLKELESLRQQGAISPREAYERHMALLGPAPPAVQPSLPSPAAVESPPPPSTSLYLWAVLLAIIGGALGIVGAFLQELQGVVQGGLLFFLFGAPVIEEALKPAGIYLLLLRWPQALAGRLHTAALTAVSGISFGLIESLVYIYIYFPGEGGDFALFRLTVPVAMHALASFSVGLGLDRGVIDWAAGRQRLAKRTRNFYLAAVGLHAVYNLLALILSIAGVVDFD